MGTQKFVAVVRKEEETSFGGEILGLGCFFTGETLEEAGEVFHTELDLSDVVC